MQTQPQTTLTFPVRRVAVNLQVPAHRSLPTNAERMRIRQGVQNFLVQQSSPSEFITLPSPLYPMPSTDTPEAKIHREQALGLFHRAVRPSRELTPEQEAYYRCADPRLENAIFVEPPEQTRRPISFQRKNNDPYTNSTQIAFQPKPMPKKQ